jgi:hypothetical protein
LKDLVKGQLHARVTIRSAEPAMCPQNLSPALAVCPLARLSVAFSSNSPSRHPRRYHRRPPCEGGAPQCPLRQQKSRLLQRLRCFQKSPLTDSNRRPPPYHGLRLRGPGTALIGALFLHLSWFFCDRSLSSKSPEPPRKTLNLSPKPVPKKFLSETVAAPRRGPEFRIAQSMKIFAAIGRLVGRYDLVAELDPAADDDVGA